MQKQSSSWLGLLLPIILATVGGALVVGEFGSSSSISPVDILMRVERFYREDLASNYASLEMSDKRLNMATEKIFLFLNEKTTDLPKFEEEVDPGMEGLIREFNSYVETIVAKTSLFFESLYEIKSLSEHILSELISEMGIFYNVGKLIYTPMNQARINEYARLLEDTLNVVNYWKDVKNIAYELPIDVGDAFYDFRMKVKDASISLKEMYETAIDFDIKCTEYLKRRCTWMLHTFVEEGRTSISDANISFVLFFNDVAALVHRYAEIVSEVKLAKKFEIHIPSVGNISIRYSEDTNPTLLNVAKAWVSTVVFLEKNHWPYEPEDLRALRATVYDDYAWMRVGSATGHATHIKKEGGLFIVRYYDEDEDVNQLFAELVGRYVPRAEVKVLKDGVEIKVSNEEDLTKVAKLLAFTTSLDIIIGHSNVQVAKRRIEDIIEKLHILG